MTARRTKTEKYPIREKLREAEEILCLASEKLNGVRDHFNMELGESKCCDLDLALTYALQKMKDAQTELDSLLNRPRLGLNFRRGRSWV